MFLSKKYFAYFLKKRRNFSILKQKITLAPCFERRMGVNGVSA